MNKINLEKSLKRWLKRKVSITLATVVVFAITGGVAFAGSVAVGGNKNVVAGGGSNVAYKGTAEAEGGNKTFESLQIVDDRLVVDTSGNGIKTNKTEETGAVAVGSNANAKGANSISIGEGSSVHSSASRGIAIGKGAHLGNYGNNSTVIGTNATAFGQSVSLGADTNAHDYAVSIGVGARAIAGANGATNVGYATYSYAKDTVTIGKNALTGSLEIKNGAEKKRGYGAISIGAHAEAYKDGSMALGKSARAGDKDDNSSLYAIAVGYNANAAKGQSIAIGGGKKDGQGAVATGSQSIAIGGNTIAEGDSSIAIGGDDTNSAVGEDIDYTVTVVKEGEADKTTTKHKTVGDIYTELTGDNLQKLTHPDEHPGNETNANNEVVGQYRGTRAGHAAVVIGDKAYAVGALGVAFGTGATVDDVAVAGTAIGAGAQATKINGIALGAGSRTDGNAELHKSAQVQVLDVYGNAIPGKTFTFNGFTGGADNLQSGDQVSVGAKGFERQIKNVAAGWVNQKSTDAINGSQLASVAGTLKGELEKAGKNTPFEYVDSDNNPVDKLDDGNYYKANSVVINPNGNKAYLAETVLGADGKGYKPNTVLYNGNPYPAGSIVSGGEVYPAGTKFKSDGTAIKSDGTPVAAITNEDYSSLEITEADREAAVTPLKRNSSEVVIQAKNDSSEAPKVVNNIKSTIGLDNKDDSGNLITAPITAEKAKETIGGTDGLLSKTEGLNTSATVGDIQAVAQAGLDFSGDNGNQTANIIHKSLSDKLEILGGANEAELVDNNIGVNTENGKLEVKLSKNLKSIKKISNKSDGSGSNIVLGNDDITLSKGTAPIQVKGLASGLVDTSGNVVQKAEDAVATNAVNAGDLAKIEAKIGAGSEKTYFHVNEGTSTQETGIDTNNLGGIRDKGLATGNYSITAGVDAQAIEKYGIAIGKNAVIDRDGTVGNGAIGSIAMGKDAHVKRDGGIAMGAESFSDGWSAFALGYSTKAKGKGAVAFGRDAHAISENAIAVGNTSRASKLKSVAIGSNSTASGESSMAMGSSSAASGESSMAIGNTAIASGNQSFAMGKTAKANSEKSFAMGNSAIANGEASFAMGNNAKTSGNLNVAIGNHALTTGTQSMAIGQGAQAKVEESLALGSFTHALGKQSVAIGNDVFAKGDMSTVIGTRYIGNRTVANGHLGHGTSTATDGKFAIAIGSGIGTNGNTVKKDQVAESDADYGIALGTSSRTESGAKASIAIGRLSQATVEGGVALGSESIANRKGFENPGAVTTTDGKIEATLDATTGIETTDKVYALDVAETGDKTKIKDTVKGSLGAVSVGTVTRKFKTRKPGHRYTGNSEEDGTAIGNDIQAEEFDIEVSTRQIINVAAGSADTDAVNVAQLKAVANVAKKKTNLTINGDNAVTDAYNTTGNIVAKKTTTDGKDTFDIKLNDKIELGTGDNQVVVDGTTGKIKAGKVTVDGDAGTVSGLTNTTFDKNATYTGGKAATQEQLKLVFDEAEAHTTVSEGAGVSIVKSGADAKDYKVSVNIDDTTITTETYDDNGKTKTRLKVKDAGITTDKLADDGVTLAKLNDDVKGVIE
ncbi:MAG: hypothetical protein CR959_01190, partial [Fusobacteriales bacterium]